MRSTWMGNAREIWSKLLYGLLDKDLGSLHNTYSQQCPDGEIGRRTSFRCWRLHGRGGSSPLPGTTDLILEGLRKIAGLFCYSLSVLF